MRRLTDEQAAVRPHRRERRARGDSLVSQLNMLDNMGSLRECLIVVTVAVVSSEDI